MNQYYQKMYEGADVASSNSNIISFRAPHDGTINRFVVWTDSNVSSDINFDVKINGISVTGLGNWLTVSNSTNKGTKTVSISVSEGDFIILYLSSSPLDPIQSPIEFQVRIDDGE